MTKYEQILYLLGYTKATIEWLGSAAIEEKSYELFNLLAEFEQHFNREINKIFS